MAGILALAFSPGCFGQAVIRIRVVNVKTGRPVPKQTVTVSMLYDKNEKTPAKYSATLRLETDANGEAQLGLPEPAPLN